MILDAPVLLVGNGPVEEAMVALALHHCGAVVAADGGAESAVDLGLELAAIIGDMDSCPVDFPVNSKTQIIEINDQSTTDFEKCLDVIEAPIIIGVGFLGGRLDHELAALNTLAGSPQNVVLIGEEDLVFKLRPHSELTLPLGTRISIFPYGTGEGIISNGLAWPLTGQPLAPDGAVSISNRTVAKDIEIWAKDTPLLCVLPRTYLPAALNLFHS